MPRYVEAGASLADSAYFVSGQSIAASFCPSHICPSIYQFIHDRALALFANIPNVAFRSANERPHAESVPAVLNVAHVVLSLEVGGLERLVVELIREGARLGNLSTVVCLEREGRLASQAAALGAEVHSMGKPPGVRLATTRALARHFRRRKPDVVHCHQIGALFYAGPAARRAGVPVVVHTEHGKNYGHRRRTRLLGRWAGRQAHKFCCVSEDIAAEVRRARIVAGNKVAVVPNGIDVQRFADLKANPGAPGQNLKSDLGIPPKAAVVGTVGRLHEIKRLDLLLESFAKLLSAVPDAHLLIVGDGPLRCELERLAASRLPAGQFHFVGYQAEPERYLALMDVFALTSRSEGMPLSILEAWAAGAPVVASAVGGVPELIADGDTGLLFPYEDTKAATTAMTRLLSDPDLAARLAAAGRARVEREY
ncbi:MAG: glycosyltransferase, partial [Pirellulales bacterium]